MMMYKKALMVPVFTASLVPSNESSNSEEPESIMPEKTTDLKIITPKSPKKHDVLFGDPIIKSLHTTRQSRSRIKKSRSTLSILRLKSSYIRFRYLKTRYLRSCVSKSPDVRYFTSRSPSLTPSTSYSKSIKTASPITASTYTINDSKSGCSSPLENISPNSVSVCLSLASFGSSSPFSGSHISRPSYSTLNYLNSHSPVSEKYSRSPSKSPDSRLTCLRRPDSRFHSSRSPLTKSCLKPPKSTHPPSESSAKPSCLKSKSSPLKTILPQKSCLRSLASKSPDSLPPVAVYRRSCIRTLTTKSLNSKPSPVQRSCLKSSVLTSLTRKSSGSKPRCSRLDSVPKSLKQLNPNFKKPTLKPPKSKSPCPKSVSFKTPDSKPFNSKSPISLKVPSKTPKSNPVPLKASNLKTSASKSPQSRTPQSITPRSASPALRSHLVRSPRPGNQIILRYGSPPPPNNMREKSPPTRDSAIPFKCATIKHHHSKNLPRLTVSKIHESRLSFKRSRRLKRPLRVDGRRITSRSLVKLCEYKLIDSQARLTKQPYRNANTEYFEKLLSTKMNVHYMVELKNYFDRIKSNFSLKPSFTCNKPECTALQERLRKHRIEHHERRTHDPLLNEGDPKGSEAQTKITLTNLGGVTISLETQPKATNTPSQDGIEGGYGGSTGYGRGTDFEISPLIDQFITDVESAVRQWVEKVPTKQPEDKKQKEDVVRNLINHITAIDFTGGNPDAEDMLKDEIDRGISQIKMWYPGSKRDREAFKQGLRENLFDKITPIYKKLLDDLENQKENIRNDDYNRGKPNAGAIGKKIPSSTSYLLKPGQSVTIVQGKKETPALKILTDGVIDNLSPTQKQKYQDGLKPSIKIDDNPSYETAVHVPDIAGRPRRPSLKSGINSSTNLNPNTLNNTRNELENNIPNENRILNDPNLRHDRPDVIKPTYYKGSSAQSNINGISNENRAFDEPYLKQNEPYNRQLNDPNFRHDRSSGIKPDPTYYTGSSAQPNRNDVSNVNRAFDEPYLKQIDPNVRPDRPDGIKREPTYYKGSSTQPNRNGIFNANSALDDPYLRQNDPNIRHDRPGSTKPDPTSYTGRSTQPNRNDVSNANRAFDEPYLRQNDPNIRHDRPGGTKPDPTSYTGRSTQPNRNDVSNANRAFDEPYLRQNDPNIRHDRPGGTKPDPTSYTGRSTQPNRNDVSNANRAFDEPYLRHNDPNIRHDRPDGIKPEPTSYTGSSTQPNRNNVANANRAFDDPYLRQNDPNDRLVRPDGKKPDRTYFAGSSTQPNRGGSSNANRAFDESKFRQNDPNVRHDRSDGKTPDPTYLTGRSTEPNREGISNANRVFDNYIPNTGNIDGNRSKPNGNYGKRSVNDSYFRGNDNLYSNKGYSDSPLQQNNTNGNRPDNMDNNRYISNDPKVIASYSKNGNNMGRDTNTTGYKDQHLQLNGKIDKRPNNVANNRYVDNDPKFNASNSKNGNNIGRDTNTQGYKDTHLQQNGSSAQPIRTFDESYLGQNVANKNIPNYGYIDGNKSKPNANRGINDPYSRGSDNLYSDKGYNDLPLPQSDTIDNRAHFIKSHHIDNDPTRNPCCFKNRNALGRDTSDLSFGYGNSFKNGCATMNRYSTQKRHCHGQKLGDDLLGVYEVGRSKSSIHSPDSRCTIQSKDICGCPGENKTVKHKVCCGLRVVDMEREISDWLRKCTVIKHNGLINKQEVIDALIANIAPYLSKPCSTLNKAVLKVKIMNVLRGLGMCANTTSGMKMIIQRLAEELSNRLIGVVSRLECSGKTSWKCNIKANRPFRCVEQVSVGANQINRENFKYDLIQEFEYCLRGTKVADDRDVLENITEIILERIEHIRQGVDDAVKRDIKNILENTNVLSEGEVENILNNIMKNTRDMIIMITNINDRTGTIVTARPCLTKTISIYASEQDVTPSFASPGSSTPKKKGKKDVSKFSTEEKAYFDAIVSVIREWIEHKPKNFKNLSDKNMNEVIIIDLAGELVDDAKLGQLIQFTESQDSILGHYIFKWLHKFEVLDDLREARPYVNELIKKLKAIPVPQLTRPQQGSRQIMKNLQQAGTAKSFSESYNPEAQDILEDEISIWMNEYPSDIYVNKEKSEQNKLVHEFAEKIKNKKKTDKNVSKEIKNWLKKVVKPNEKNRLDSMSTSLKERITKVPQDETLAARLEKKAQEKKEWEEDEHVSERSQNLTEEEENDNTMKEFIVKYVEHNCDEVDPLAKGAYVKLLTSELRRLSPQILEEVQEGQPLEKFAPQTLFKELQYIKDLSDWLKTLPIDENFNKVGNKRRIDFIINLAKEINNIEEERLQSPNLMNFDDMIGSVICQYMHSIPLRLPHKTNIDKYVHPILIKIFSKREGGLPPIPQEQLWTNIAEFLDDYVRLNGQDIADDEAKMEVWATRLLQEIKKMIAKNPSTLPVADVNDRLAKIAKPGDETVKRFNRELDYAKEISDWLKNFPLIESVDEEMIRDLSEKMSECESETDDSELTNYVQQWLSKLPLDRNKPVDVPLVTRQLLNRKKKVIDEKASKRLPLNESKSASAAGTAKSRADVESVKSQCRGCCPVDDPGNITVQVIKEWCDKLPLEGTEIDIKNTKANIANKLYQKIIEINDNPRMSRNDIFYLESLIETIDEIIDNLPSTVKLKGDRERLKTKLFENLRQARIFSKQVTLGDDYMKDLEDAIDIALPNPAGAEAIVDPAFEMYKENMTEKFILDNFDHGNDADSQKYKNAIQTEIDKFSQSAQQRTSMSVPEEQLNNNTLSVLFDVNMPVENAMQDNVEEIKTKCEVNDWVLKLPLRPISGPAEVLERDQNVRLLARKIHILEFEENPDEKILREISKFLSKAPLLPGEERNIDKFADNLQDILKKTRKNRKCVLAADVVLKPTDEENSVFVNPNISIDKHQIQQQPRHKTGDILLDIVERWSNNIPLPPDIRKDQGDAMKDDVTVQIIKKISELNSDPNTFNNDRLYDQILKQEIEKALTGLPQGETLIHSKCALVHQLTSAIGSMKPLIREERARHQYKTELETTVSNFLGAPVNPSPGEQTLFDKINEEIVDDFLEYQYNKNDEHGKEFYKSKLLNALTKYNFIGESEENRNEIISDTLVETNRLLCELKSVIAPRNIDLKDEVEEIRMKHEVDNFLNKVSPPPAHSKSTRRTSIRDSLAKQLHEIEKEGYTDANTSKMSAAVSRTLKRLSAGGKTDEIQPFIEKLQKNEPVRRAPLYSPSKHLKQYMGYPPQDSATMDDHGFHERVQVSVHQPPPQRPPPPSPSRHTQQELVIVMPRKPLPSSPGPSVEIPIRQRATQPTQTPTLRSGITQTSSTPGVTISTRPQSLQVPAQYGQQARPAQTSTILPPSQVGSQPGQYVQQGQLRTTEAKPSQQPSTSHAGVQSGENVDENCLCEMCMKNPCEMYNYFDCDFPPPMMRPMMFPPCMMPPPYML